MLCCRRFCWQLRGVRRRLYVALSWRPAPIVAAVDVTVTVAVSAQVLEALPSAFTRMNALEIEATLPPLMEEVQNRSKTLSTICGEVRATQLCAHVL